MPPREYSSPHRASLPIPSLATRRHPARAPGRARSRAPPPATLGFKSASGAADLTLLVSEALQLSCSFFRLSRPLFSITSGLFCKIPGGWVPQKTYPLESATCRLFFRPVFATWLPHPVAKPSDGHARGVSPLKSALTKSALLTPLESALTKTPRGVMPPGSAGKSIYGSAKSSDDWSAEAN